MRYKSMHLEPLIYELEDGTGWAAEVDVAEEIGAATIVTQFILRRTYQSEELAIEAALHAGFKVIDDRIKLLGFGSISGPEFKLPCTHKTALGAYSDDIGNRNGWQIGKKITAPETSQVRRERKKT